MARNQGQEAVLTRKTMNFTDIVSLSLTLISPKSAASPLSLLLEANQEARNQGQEAVLSRKAENIVETVHLSLPTIPTKSADARSETQRLVHSPGWQTPAASHKSPSTLKRNRKRR